jgi:hypothetical protein
MKDHTYSIEEWKFWTPLSKAVETGTGERKIKGIASTKEDDLQGEIVDQGGIDVSYFMKHGYFNNDHKPGFENKVGQPTLAKHTRAGLYVEGFLWKKGVHKVADSIWELIHALEASEANRQVGMSIQGKTRKRDGNVILKCWIQDIAITPAPINTNTWVDVLKSLTGCEWCSHQGTNVCVGCGACKSLAPKDEEDDRSVTEQKALSVGHGNPTATGGSSGSALRTESLDSDAKDQLFGGKEKERRLNKGEVTKWIQDSMGYSYATSALYTEALFEINNARGV